MPSLKRWLLLKKWLLYFHFNCSFVQLTCCRGIHSGNVDLLQSLPSLQACPLDVSWLGKNVEKLEDISSRMLFDDFLPNLRTPPILKIWLSWIVLTCCCLRVSTVLRRKDHIHKYAVYTGTSLQVQPGGLSLDLVCLRILFSRPAVFPSICCHWNRWT
jgi:hypothetical protein